MTRPTQDGLLQALLCVLDQLKEESEPVAQRALAAAMARIALRYRGAVVAGRSAPEQES